MKNKKNVFMVLIIAALIGLGYLLYTHIKESQNNHRIKVSGSIEGDDVRLSFRVSGQIEQLMVDEGDVLKKGDVVAKLKTDELSKTRDNAAAALKAKEYEYALAKVDYERAENLLSAGATTAQKRDSAKTKADSLRSDVDKLKASLDLAQTQLDFTTLTTTLDGYVLVKSALAGEVVQIGSPVFTVIDLDNIWVTAYINETDLGKVKLGQKANVETDSYKGKKYNGKISFISSQAEFTPKYIQTTEERVKYVYRIKVKVDNSSLDLKPGMPADAYISIE
jgi:HlyD family secretion protein